VAARACGDAAKLVVLTNYATPEMRSKCLALGADAVFDKSNDIDALIGYCERLAAAADPASASGSGAARA
jgi:DNA-binding NarL/FixJ family response regulator